MIEEKAIQYFTQYPDVRVLFLFDEDGTFKDEIDQLTSPSFQVIHETGNYFFLKLKFHSEWVHEKILLYCPYSSEKAKQPGYALMDLYQANKELILEDEGELLIAYHLDESKRGLLRKYKKELKFNNIKQVLHPILERGDFDSKDIDLGLMSAFLRFKQPVSPTLIIAKFLTLRGDQPEFSRFRNKILDNDLLESFNRLLKNAFDVKLTEITETELELLLKKLKYNLIIQHINVQKEEDPYKHLLISDKRCLNFLNQLIDDSEKAGLKEALDKVMAAGGSTIHELRLVQLYGNKVEYGYITQQMRWEFLRGWVDKMDASPQAVISHLNQLYAQDTNDVHYKNVLDIFLNSAQLILSINSIADFVLDKPEEYIEHYTKDWYRIDSYYRRAIYLKRQIDEVEAPELIGLSSLFELIQTRYDQFLLDLNREWLACLNHFDFDYSRIGSPKQFNFYEEEVKHYDQKVVVVISDALRFECAQDLLSEMHKDARNTAQIRYRLASIPSKTSVGMAQLLPKGRLKFDSGRIIWNDVSTEGMENRQSILSAENEDSRVSSYKEVETLSQDENRALFKSSVVYIYHDVIDTSGDNRRSEYLTFDAVQTAIKDLSRLVKKVHSSYNVARVLITADHGFLYSDKTIQEKDKENGFDKDAIQKHNRYEITSAKISSDRAYTFPLKSTTKLECEDFVSITKSINRIKRQGVGHQFVHGGGSLQELIVPVIESTRKGEKVEKKVNPVIVNKDRLKIVSNVCKVIVLQEQKVSRSHKERHLSLALYKGTSLISNEVKHRLSSVDDSPSSRTKECVLRLESEYGSETMVKLKIFDEEDMLNPLIEINIQNSSLIATDF